jgi:hypothetical protein
MEDLRSSWSFVTIPPQDQGSYTVKHEVPRDKINAANLKPGEKYRVALTDKCLGTRWWAFVSLEELDGVRLGTWRSREEEEARKCDSWLEAQMEKERREKFGDGPVSMGEQPEMLAMVPEVGSVEVEVV